MVNKKLLLVSLFIFFIGCSTTSQIQNQSSLPNKQTKTITSDELRGVGYALMLPAAAVGLIIGLLI